eukprot:COSAG06_NODE_47410_length_339_cov_0.866667_1_plen_24_part_10
MTSLVSTGMSSEEEEEDERPAAAP